MKYEVRFCRQRTDNSLLFLYKDISIKVNQPYFHINQKFKTDGRYKLLRVKTNKLFHDTFTAHRCRTTNKR